MKFSLKSSYTPTGDQPHAIDKLLDGVKNKASHQTLLGVTGSGKTFTIANLIQKSQLPTLIISHNKTLAAQLYQEFRDYFPDNAVSYFVSYYDYYQPEAYIPSTDTYIEKETNINDEIDKLRLSATTNLLTRPDCIVVASVSCIYNLGSPIEYGKFILELVEGQVINRETIYQRLADLQYSRSDYELQRGYFRVKGDTLTVWPAYEDFAVKITTLENKIEKCTWVDPLTGKSIDRKVSGHLIIYPAKHYLTDPKSQSQAFSDIRNDLQKQLKKFKSVGKIVESYRLEQKVNYDLENIEEFGFTNGIENYSRYFDGRNPGDPPYTLLDHFQHNAKTFHQGSFLTVIDESHITVPQIKGMNLGDSSRKQTLIDYGFRLPSALDNRPLKLAETLERLPQIVYTSATPSNWEIEKSEGKIVEQLVRPTGLLDPEIEIRPIEGQIENLTIEIINTIALGGRVLVTTLTKKMAEALTDYLNDKKKISKLMKMSSEFVYPKVQYLHSDVDTLDRSDILDSLRKGEYDVLIGINLLREGLDLPEVRLVAILDADKEGFLRSRTSLIQTMGRAARHKEGRVLMYADKVTPSMQAAIDETTRRRQVQKKYNSDHGITPMSIDKPIREQLIKREKPEDKEKEKKNRKILDFAQFDKASMTPQDKSKAITHLTKRMKQAAKDWDFETAAKLRDFIAGLQIDN